MKFEYSKMASAKVENIVTDPETGRVFITYSYAPPRILDELPITLRKGPDISWAEFKERVIDILDDLEKNERHLEGFGEVVLDAIPAGATVADLECPACGSYYNEDGTCPTGCGNLYFDGDYADEEDLEHEDFENKEDFDDEEEEND
jgi:hypothetical protein